MKYEQLSVMIPYLSYCQYQMYMSYSVDQCGHII